MRRNPLTPQSSTRPSLSGTTLPSLPLPPPFPSVTSVKVDGAPTTVSTASTPSRTTKVSGVSRYTPFTRTAVLEVPHWFELAQKSRYSPDFDTNAPKVFKMFIVSKVSCSRPVSVEASSSCSATSGTAEASTTEPHSSSSVGLVPSATKKTVGWHSQALGWDRLRLPHTAWIA